MFALRIFGPVSKETRWLSDRDRPLANLLRNIASAHPLRYPGLPMELFGFSECDALA
jgi:hypothetical protein